MVESLEQKYRHPNIYEAGSFNSAVMGVTSFGLPVTEAIPLYFARRKLADIDVAHMTVGHTRAVDAKGITRPGRRIDDPQILIYWRAGSVRTDPGEAAVGGQAADWMVVS